MRTFGPYARMGTPRVIGQSSIPFIVVGSGTIGNNGALTLTTALSSSPPITSAYILLPAGAIATGVPAAATWYYAVFFSTIAATVYNNTYTSGTPVIPSSPTPFVTTGPGAYTGVSTAVTAYNISIPGNMFGLNGGLRLTYTGQTTNSASSKIIVSSYGSMTLFSLTASTTAAYSQLVGFKNAGQTGQQFALMSPTGSNIGASSANLMSGTVDTTIAQTLSITLTNTTPASNNLMLANVTVELLPSVP